MDDKEAVAIESVRRSVRSGFYDPGALVAIIDESIFEPNEIDQGWLRAQVEQEFRRKRAEEAAWPDVTDCDRLDRVFESLENQGIMALQNAGQTQSDGL